MKKNILLLFSLCLMISCSEDSEDSTEDNLPVECGNIALTSVSQDGSILNFNYQGNTTFNFYEIGYDATSSTSGQGNGQFFFNNSFTTTDANATSIEDEGLNFYAENNQTVSFFIRAQCQSGDITSWQGPIVLQIDSYCEKPDNLMVENGTAFWNYNNQPSASFFQVEYGQQGFQLGTGEIITTNSESTSDAALVAGNTYDFYVRASCDNNLGYSSWKGPSSYFAEFDQNLCNAPSNLQYFVEYISGNSAGVRFEWDYNGEDQFEYVLVGNNGNPDNGTINTIGVSGWPVYTGLSVFSDYDFYVRGVCNNGTRTSWAGPLDVNP